MSRQVDKNTYLLVEGVSDQKFFEPRIDKSVTVFSYKGKDLVIEIIQSLNKIKSMDRYLGIVDKDYWGIVGGAASQDNLIIPIDFNDIENMLFSENNILKVLIENGDRDKYKSLLPVIRDNIFSEAYKIATIRLYNENIYSLFPNFVEARSCQLSLGKIDICDHVDETKLEFNRDVVLSRLIMMSAGASLNPSSIKNKVMDMEAKYPNKHSVCNGHDLVSVLTVAFRKMLGSFSNISRSRVESWLRMAFDSAEFAKTDLYKKIKDWEALNKTKILVH